MVDGFHGLGHYPVVRRHHQDSNVGDASAAGSNGGKGFVTGSVQKGDFVSIQFHLVGAHVLGNAACFFVRHLSLPDGIQETGFPVIHMTENSYHRWSGNQISFIIPSAEAAGSQCAGLF